jgi:hypothetical protein
MRAIGGGHAERIAFIAGFDADERRHSRGEQARRLTYVVSPECRLT